jgi:hypothetical protein
MRSGAPASWNDGERSPQRIGRSTRPPGIPEGSLSFTMTPGLSVGAMTGHASGSLSSTAMPKRDRRSAWALLCE